MLFLKWPHGPEQRTIFTEAHDPDLMRRKPKRYVARRHDDESAKFGYESELKATLEEGAGPQTFRLYLAGRPSRHRCDPQTPPHLLHHARQTVDARQRATTLARRCQAHRVGRLSRRMAGDCPPAGHARPWLERDFVSPRYSPRRTRRSHRLGERGDCHRTPNARRVLWMP